MVSLWLPSFATDRLTRRRDASRPGWRSEPASAEGPPLATVTAAQGGLRIAAATPAARAAGVVPGLPLADARALVPGLRTAAADPAGDGRALAALADWCGRYTPWTAVNGGDGVWLDISGCAHLLGGETALLEDLGRRLKGLGFHGLAAAADTPGAAWAVARFAGRRTGAATVVPPGVWFCNSALPAPLTSAFAGTGPPYHLHSQISQHFLAFLDSAVPDEADVGAAGHGGGAPQGGGVTLRVDVDFGVADLNRKDVDRTRPPFRFVVDVKTQIFIKLNEALGVGGGHGDMVDAYSWHDYGASIN
ncbi:MAG: DNA polymerase Y family protein [Proteobacteria bacterium]|nr:DNA polymerase Y family protein [Pseudomonadota bacterium]